MLGNSDDISSIDWDAVIVGTGLTESLVAASLSRAGKSVLHIDKHEYYGDNQAAFALDEIKSWVDNLDSGSKAGLESTPWSSFHSASYHVAHQSTNQALGSSRAYSLSLSPELLYTNSKLLPSLVKSGLHESLEFIKMGNWFNGGGQTSQDREESSPSLQKVPCNREDIFKNKSMDLKTKRSIVRILKSVVGNEAPQEMDGSLNSKESKFAHSMTSAPYNLPEEILPLLSSLVLSIDNPNEMSLDYASNRIKRHLTSFGRLGPGFGAVIAKYGGSAELAQVFCRAAAVAGGGVYVLGESITSVTVNEPRKELKYDKDEEDVLLKTIHGYKIKLKGGHDIWSANVIGTAHNLWAMHEQLLLEPPSREGTLDVRRGIFIVSHPLEDLFDTVDPPRAAGAVVYYPALSIRVGDANNQVPIYVIAHSSDTGECPRGQSVLYAISHASTSCTNDDSFLQAAVLNILSSITRQSPDMESILANVYYSQRYYGAEQGSADARTVRKQDGLHIVPVTPLDLALSDEIVDEAISIYKRMIGTEEGFMIDTVNNPVMNGEEGDI